MLHRFADLVCLEAGAAYFYPLDTARKQRADFVQVRIETTLGGIHSVAAVVANLGALSTNITYS